MTSGDLALLACPSCLGELCFEGTVERAALRSGVLRCQGPDQHEWGVRDGLPHLIDEARVGTLEALLRIGYDYLGALHQPAAWILLPLLDGTPEPTARAHYLRRLELDLLPRPGSRPVRILEVGIGTGESLPFLRDALHDEVEIWGVDLSAGMIALCRKRSESETGEPVRLLLADAHALPFASDSFDRVFHVGAINSYRDARVALAEMARVARPGTPIVVVDEQLDPGRTHALWRRLVFRALTFYDPHPGAPIGQLPPEAIDVRVEQVSRFYYCLTFRFPRGGRSSRRGR